MSDARDITNVCRCGHDEARHSALHGFCLQSLDIDIECPCSSFEHTLTFVHDIDGRYFVELARLEAIPVDLDQALADAARAFDGA